LRKEVLISTGGGQYPEWGAGGRELFYVRPDNKLMAGRAYDRAGSGAIFRAARAVHAAHHRQRLEPPLTMIVNWPALLMKGSAAETTPAATASTA
jgi:hypothetical protein